MKTMIAVPCMDVVPVQFMMSLMCLDKDEEVSLCCPSGSLVYDSRNQIIQKAMEAGVDRIMWFDSDMTFQPDTMQRFHNMLDQGFEIVSGLYFKRRPPYTPVIFEECYIKEEGGLKYPTHKFYENYPKDTIFEVAAFGFGGVMMTMDAVRRITEKFGNFPFMPVAGFGEDMSFCLRAKEAGVKLWCDSTIKLGHVGYHAFGEKEYEGGGPCLQK